MFPIVRHGVSDLLNCFSQLQFSGMKQRMITHVVSQLLADTVNWYILLEIIAFWSFYLLTCGLVDIKMHELHSM